MKKLFILATAVLATVACSKTEVLNETSENGPAIAFQVANYAGQTKAETSLKDEGFESFKTYAWYTSSVTSNQEFMAPATVEWKSTAKEWAPTDHVYYWPKTGYINFFSFAGKHLPDAVELNGSSQAEAHYTTAITVATNDNILIADGAYGFFNNDAAQYKLDGVTKGVPTLFRHMLSRVKFDVKVDASDATDPLDYWKVTITSASATVTYCNQGTLEVGFPSTPTITLGSDNKPTTAGTTLQYTSAVWTPGSTTNTLTNSGNIEFEVNGGDTSSVEELIADNVVMPQTLATTGVTVALTYTLEHKYNGGTAISEVVPVSAELATLSPTVSAWAPTTTYAYHIIINPAADNKTLFDPAVEEWTAESNEPTYTIE